MTFESNGTDTTYYTRDSGGSLLSMNLNGTEYYYVYNNQGDVIGLIDKAGTRVVTYTYDTWGVLLSTTGTLADTVGKKNPYRYRGYRYDTATGLYYLQSRYYNPEWGRFINADSLAGQTGDVLSTNLFAYTENNPVNAVDPTGYMAANGAGGVTGSTADLISTIEKVNGTSDAAKEVPIWDDPFLMMLDPELGGVKAIATGLAKLAEKEVTKSVVKNAAKGASKNEFVDIYRAVGPDEYYDIMDNKMFRSSTRSLSGKQFGNSFDEILKLSDHLPDTSAIIKARIPKSVYNQLDHTPVDSFILKSGSVTVQPNRLNLFNNSLIEIKHMY